MQRWATEPGWNAETCDVRGLAVERFPLPPDRGKRECSCRDAVLYFFLIIWFDFLKLKKNISKNIKIITCNTDTPTEFYYKICTFLPQDLHIVTTKFAHFTTRFAHKKVIQNPVFLQSLCILLQDLHIFTTGFAHRYYKICTSYYKICT